jgi:hypothetical protein
MVFTLMYNVCILHISMATLSLHFVYIYILIINCPPISQSGFGEILVIMVWTWTRQLKHVVYRLWCFASYILLHLYQF